MQGLMEKDMENKAPQLNLVSVPLKMKGTFLPAMLIQPNTRHLAQLKAALQQRIQKSPGLMHSTPLVLGLNDRQTEVAWVESVIALLAELKLPLKALRSDDEAVCQLARSQGLLVMNPVDRATPAANQDEKPQALVHQGTVRGGQQLVSENGDLIIIGSVNAGAEVLAAGHVHVYGALRGRALAGIYGDQQAQIFSYDLQAELVAVAGRYLTSQTADQLSVGKPARIYLQEEQLKCQLLAP